MENKLKNISELINNRRYLCLLNNGEKRHYFFRNGEFYDEYDTEFPIIDELIIDYETSYDKNQLLISGTYGDLTVLILDGYVRTKYGDFLKIAKVDIDSETIYCYGNESFDFSRIASSSTNNDNSKKTYFDCLLNKLNMLGIKIGNEIDYNGEISEIISIDKNEKKFTYDISLKDEIIHYSFNMKYEIIKKVLTIEEKLNDIIGNNTNAFDKIYNMNKFKKEILNLINN